MSLSYDAVGARPIAAQDIAAQTTTSAPPRRTTAAKADTVQSPETR